MNKTLTFFLININYPPVNNKDVQSYNLDNSRDFVSTLTASEISTFSTHCVNRHLVRMVNC